MVVSFIGLDEATTRDLRKGMPDDCSDLADYCGFQVHGVNYYFVED